MPKRLSIKRVQDFRTARMPNPIKPIRALMSNCAKRIPTNEEALRLVQGGKVFQATVLPKAERKRPDIIWNNISTAQIGKLRVGAALLDEEGRMIRSGEAPGPYVCVAVISFQDPERRLHHSAYFIKAKTK